MSDLRQHFFNIMCELAKHDSKIHILTGDLGYSFFEQFAEKFPNQFTNVGIAEQHMVGMAAGMAIAGKKPYCYSGAVFLCTRAYEFVRDDIAYNNTNVKLISTGAADFLGFTHNFQGKENEEDLLKNLPNLMRYYPKNKEQLKKALNNKGATYIRL